MPGSSEGSVTMYHNRTHAGQILAGQLAFLANEDPVILAIPRGGVETAAPVAEVLRAPLYALVTRKVGHPANREVAIGALMPDGSALGDEEMLDRMGLSFEQFREMADREQTELARRLLLYGRSGALPDTTGRTVVIVDDGIATGYTVKAAVMWLKNCGAKRIIVAVPVGPPDVVREIGHDAEVVCPLQDSGFLAVGMYYADFGDSPEKAVLDLLARHQSGGCRSGRKKTRADNI